MGNVEAEYHASRCERNIMAREERVDSTGKGVLVYDGSGYFRQRIILSLLSKKAIRIKNIRSKSNRINTGNYGTQAAKTSTGIAYYEASLLRLVWKLTQGTQICINKTGTVLDFTPGILMPAESVQDDDGFIVHKCHASRPLSYYLQVVAAVGVFFGAPLKLKLYGSTEICTSHILNLKQHISAAAKDSDIDADYNAYNEADGDADIQKILVGRSNNDAQCSAQPEETNAFLNSHQPDMSIDQFRMCVLPLMRKMLPKKLRDELDLKVERKNLCEVFDAHENIRNYGLVKFFCPIVTSIEPFEIIDFGLIKNIRGVCYSKGNIPKNILMNCVGKLRKLLNPLCQDVWIYASLNKAGTDIKEKSADIKEKNADKKEKNADNKEKSTAKNELGITLACNSTRTLAKGTTFSLSLPANKNLDSRNSLDCSNLDVFDNEYLLSELSANVLISEMLQEGVCDSESQFLPLLFMAISADHCPCRVKLGPLTKYSVQMIRHIRDFFGIIFEFLQLDDHSVILSTVGINLKNISRTSF